MLKVLRTIFTGVAGFSGTSYLQDESFRQGTNNFVTAINNFYTACNNIDDYPDTVSEAGIPIENGVPGEAPQLESDVRAQISEIEFFRNFDPADPQADIDKAIEYFKSKPEFSGAHPDDIRASLQDAPSAKEAWGSCETKIIEETGVNTALRDCPVDSNIFSLTERYKADLEANANQDALAYIDAKQAIPDKWGEMWSAMGDFIMSSDVLVALTIATVIGLAVFFKSNIEQAVCQKPLPNAI